MICLMAAITYMLSKGVTLVAKHNPTITQAIEVGSYDDSDKFNFKKENFMIAVGVFDAISGEPKNDPNYVRWLVQVTGSDGTKVEQSDLLKYHICNTTDFSKFYDVEKRF